ncbi:MAG: CocE/NonD family hydrolase, partial [Terriglobales bacterium]
MRKHNLALLAAIAAAAVPAWSQGFTLADYAKTDAMIAMRDGVKLHTEIYAPRAAHPALPFLITRTPYGTADDARGFSGILRDYSEMIPEGYLFVVQDIRGRYRSEGQFVMNRPPRSQRDQRSIDEG